MPEDDKSKTLRDISQRMETLKGTYGKAIAESMETGPKRDGRMALFKMQTWGSTMRAILLDRKRRNL